MENKTIKDCFASVWQTHVDGTIDIFCVDKDFKRLPKNVTEELLLKYATHNERHPATATSLGHIFFVGNI